MNREEGILWENSLYFHPLQLQFQRAFFGIRMEGTCAEVPSGAPVNSPSHSIANIPQKGMLHIKLSVKVTLYINRSIYQAGAKIILNFILVSGPV